MDEPLASLDQELKSKIVPYLKRIRDEFRVPMLYVSAFARRTDGALRPSHRYAGWPVSRYLSPGVRFSEPTTSMTLKPEKSLH